MAALRRRKKRMRRASRARRPTMPTATPTPALAAVLSSLWLTEALVSADVGDALWEEELERVPLVVGLVMR
jgi:hypothetical protein